MILIYYLHTLKGAGPTEAADELGHVLACHLEPVVGEERVEVLLGTQLKVLPRLKQIILFTYFFVINKV